MKWPDCRKPAEQLELVLSTPENEDPHCCKTLDPL